jgi:small subunit ribosomal protein S6
MTQQFTSVIKGYKGEVTKTEFCGLRPLAYAIKKNKKGHYVLLNIACLAEGVAEMERQMKINEDILRYLSVRVETLDNQPSALMQRNYREENLPSFNDEDFDSGAAVDESTSTNN